MGRKNYIAFSILFLLSVSSKAQILFSEECFIGGVTTGGKSGFASGDATFEIDWDDDYTLRKAYLLTYRYGTNLVPQPVVINSDTLFWTMDSQIGPTQIESNPLSDFFAVHAQDVTDQIEINSNTVFMTGPIQPQNPGGSNYGFWSNYLVIYYESPSITTPICSRIYTASQNQEYFQTYSFSRPVYQSDTPVLLALHSDRINDFTSDAATSFLNGFGLGIFWGGDLINPTQFAGVQGHFYYKNGACEGLNGDTANFYFNNHDGIARIENRLESGNQTLTFASTTPPLLEFNPIPAFLITYTPQCAPESINIEQSYSKCPEDAIELIATGYENYSWSPEVGLTNPGISNPICTADSSIWYTVTMWNETGCSQTLPVHVLVHKTPRPDYIAINAAICPFDNGEIVLDSIPGNVPFSFFLNDLPVSGTIENLAADTYNLSILSAESCVWDTAIVIASEAAHEAIFFADRDSGYTPLEVLFENFSWPSSTDFDWYVNGAQVSNLYDLTYIFEEPGIYEIRLRAYREEEDCFSEDSFTLLVKQGFELAVPNIITPNGDGLNDDLVILSERLAELRWQIYTRWGEQIAQGNISNPGTSFTIWEPNIEFEEGEYFLVLTAFGDDGRLEQIEQTVSLRR